MTPPGPPVNGFVAVHNNGIYSFIDNGTRGVLLHCTMRGRKNVVPGHEGLGVTSPAASPGRLGAGAAASTKAAVNHKVPCHQLDQML